MNATLKVFIYNMAAIDQDDARSFVQMANRYLNQLRYELPFVADENIVDVLDIMNSRLLNTFNENIRTTAEQLQRDAKYIDQLLAGDKQNWESTPLRSLLDEQTVSLDP